MHYRIIIRLLLGGPLLLCGRLIELLFTDLHQDWLRLFLGNDHGRLLLFRGFIMAVDVVRVDLRVNFLKLVRNRCGALLRLEERVDAGELVGRGHVDGSMRVLIESCESVSICAVIGASVLLERGVRSAQLLFAVEAELSLLGGGRWLITLMA